MKKLLTALPVGLRLLLGALLVVSGSFWLRRPDIGGYLADSIVAILEMDRTVPIYRPFLEHVVLPNGVLIGLLAVTVYWEAGRRLGFDRRLQERWPAARIW